MRSAVWILAGLLAVAVFAGAAPAAPIPSEVNVALGKLTSGDSLNPVLYPTSAAVDGIKTTTEINSFTHGVNNYDSYWRVNLQGDYDLGSIRVTDRMGFPDRTNGATMRVYGADGVTQIGPDTVLDRFILPNPGSESEQTVSYNNGGAGWTGAHYIQIGGPGISVRYLHLDEVAAMADVPEVQLYPGFITGVSAWANMGLSGSTGLTADELVSSAGMNDADGPIIGDPSALHTTNNEKFWHSPPNATLPTITFDLGGTYDMSSMYLWNSVQQWNSDRGFQDTEIRVSADGGQTYTLLPDINGVAQGNVTIPEAVNPVSNQWHGYHLALDLDGVRATHVQITGLSNYGDSDGYYVLAEIRFYGQWVTTHDLLGDANDDDVVDDDDASILGAHWMQPGTWADGDFNDDGVVNDKDAAILAAHWGETSGEQSVPEPGVWALLAGGLAALALRRRAG